jgi:hypothetical protein
MSEKRIHAGRRETGGSGEEEGVDIRGQEPRPIQCSPYCFFSQGMSDLDVVVVTAAKRLPIEVILLGICKISRAHTGSIEKRKQAFQIGNPRKLAANFIARFVLGEPMGGEGRTEPGDAWMLNGSAPCARADL